jgi:hypothetical protein
MNDTPVSAATDNSAQALDSLVSEAFEAWNQARHAQGTAEDKVKAAGHKFKTIREHLKATKGGSFKSWLEDQQEKLGRGFSRAAVYDYINLAEGKLTLEVLRKQKQERARTSRSLASVFSKKNLKPIPDDTKRQEIEAKIKALQQEIEGLVR